MESLDAYGVVTISTSKSVQSLFALPKGHTNS